MAQTYNFGSELARFEQTLIKTVFPADKPVTNSQFLMFLGVARAYRLNPFIREIFAFPNTDGSIVPIVSVDGWISLANRQEDYDGVEFENEWVDGKVGGQLFGVTAIIYRKLRSRPIRIQELMAECVRPTKQWQQKPLRMLRHKAFIQGLRYAYGFGGIYDEDEGERILEGTLKATTDGNFQSEIAMPRRVQVLASSTPNSASDVEFKQVVAEAGKAVGEILFRESPVQKRMKEQAAETIEAEPSTAATASGVQTLDSLQGLFDSGQVQKGTGGLPNAIGRGRAQRLYAILNKHKIHTEDECKEMFLKPLGLNHLADMPVDIYDQVCAWAQGHLEDQG